MSILLLILSQVLLSKHIVSIFLSVDNNIIGLSKKSIANIEQYKDALNILEEIHGNTYAGQSPAGLEE